MTIKLDDKNRQEGSTNYISDCLKRPRGETTIKQDVGHKLEK